MLDDELMELMIDTTHVDERNGIAHLTLKRMNTNLDQPLIVSLAANPAREIDLPAQVTIPSGEASIIVPFNGKDDFLFDGDIITSILASALNYEAASVSVVVVDDDIKTPGTNPRNRFDVDNDDSVNPLDVLVTINRINSNPSSQPITENGNYYDTDSDLSVSPLDVLGIINYINAKSGEGEAEFNFDDILLGVGFERRKSSGRRFAF